MTDWIICLVSRRREMLVTEVDCRRDQSSDACKDASCLKLTSLASTSPAQLDQNSAGLYSYANSHENAVKTLLFALCVLCIPAYAEPQDAFHSAFPFGHFQNDPAPVSFHVGDVHYKIPGNYMLDVPKSTDKNLTIASMTAVFPGMRAKNEETQHCYETAPLYRSKDCKIIEIFLFYPGTPATNDPGVLDRWRDLFHSQIPIPAPGGYELYQSGDDASKIDHYRKEVRPGLTIVVQCDGSDPVHGGICDGSMRNKAGGVVAVRFTTEDLDRADTFMPEILDFINAHIESIPTP